MNRETWTSSIRNMTPNELIKVVETNGYATEMEILLANYLSDIKSYVEEAEATLSDGDVDDYLSTIQLIRKIFSAR